MAKTLKQLQFDEKRKKVKVNKLDAELRKEKQALSSIQKAIPAQKKREEALMKKKAPVKKKK